MKFGSNPAAPPWSGIRDQFELDFTRWNFMDYMLVASPPRVVRERIEELTTSLRREPGQFVLENFDRLNQEVARSAATYLGVDPDEAWSHLALTDSTTMGLGLLFGGLRVKLTQEALTSQRSFFATRYALRSRPEKMALPPDSPSGAFYRQMTLYNEPEHVTAAEIVSTVEKEIGEQTRILALTWVQSNTGVKLPIAEIGKVVAKTNSTRAPEDRVLYCVDGVHGFAVETDTFAQLECDFLVASCHKWLFGPLGTGFICGRPVAWEEVSPTIASFMGYGDPPPARLNTPGGIHTYPYRWALAEALRWHAGLDRVKVRDYTQALASRLKRGLRGIEGIRVLTPDNPTLSAGIVCCDVEGREAKDVVLSLIDTGISATQSSTDSPHVKPRRHVRFSPSLLSTVDDIDHVLDAMCTVAKRV